jgi:uncharacterized coiled-coil DUF342 family protein
LDEKVDELFEQFNVLKSKLKEASDQAATNLGAELDEVGRELAKAYNEREAAFRATAAQWSESIDAAWEELRDHESIDALQNEIERLKQWAEAASEEGRAKLLAMADSLAEQMNVLQEDLQKRYREAAAKPTPTSRRPRRSSTKRGTPS